jgi:hypothetical protein
MTLWTQLLFSHNSEETEGLQYVSRSPRQDSLIFTQNLADVLHVQYLLLKCPNLAQSESMYYGVVVVDKP